MKHISRILVGFVVLVFAVTLRAADWPTAKPEDVGMSSERLARISPIMKQMVDNKKIPCAITMIARRGKVVFFDKHGYQDVENEIPVEDDTIFRMFSQSKPITGVAVMILYEEGKFLLDDPISKYLPEFADMRVLLHGDTGETEDAEPITVKHLLTHTAGLTYEFMRKKTPIAQMYRDAGIGSTSFFSDAKSLDEWTKKIAKQPLIAQPGTQWHYSAAMDVLARLVEVWSGKSFDTFLHERIFEPLDMRDTGFYVPPDKHDRLSVLYANVAKAGTTLPEKGNEEFRSPPTFPMGGGGLVSTPRDYFRFAQMLLNGGELDGIRILGPRTVDLMTRDHLPYSMGATPREALPDDDSNPLDRRESFGFTGSVTVVPLQGTTLSFGWGGAAGTVFWVDLEEDMTVLFFTQSMRGGQRFRELLPALSSQVIID